MKHSTPRFILAPVLLSTLLFIPELARAQECSTNADCGERYSCSFDETDSAWDCSAEAGSEAECTSREPTQSEVGWCTPDPYLCNRNADCPEPTVCNEDGECEFRFELCESDTECNAGYECTVLGRSGRCSSEPENSGKPPQAGGAEPLPDPPASKDSAPDEECEERELRACFPAPVPCQTDADCTGDWTCEEIPDGGPDSWDDIEIACLPPGITALIDGHIKAEGDGKSTGEDGSSSESPLLPDNNEDTSALLGTQGGSEGSSGASGCSFTAPDATSRRASWSSLLALALAAVWTRRRGTTSRTA